MPNGWLLIDNCRDSPAGVDMVLIQPGRGVALIEYTPAWTPDAVDRLRDFLNQAGFTVAHSGHLPVIHRKLRHEDKPDLASLLDDAFDWQEPISLSRHGAWEADLASLLIAGFGSRADSGIDGFFRRESLQPVPPQSAGPHFQLSSNGKIEIVSRSALDNAGNHRERIEHLLPLVKRSAKTILGYVAHTDAFPNLKNTLTDYIKAIDAEYISLPWGLIYGLGVLLENAAEATQREIHDRLSPSLEDEAQAALNSLRSLHGSLILASNEGRELQEQADRLNMSREEQIEFQRIAEIISIELQNDPSIIGPDAAKVVLDASRSVGAGRYPERGSIFGITTVRHVSTVVISAALFASFIPLGNAYFGVTGASAGAGVAWVGYESLKKTEIFASAIGALGPRFDFVLKSDPIDLLQQISNLASFKSFVVKNENILRQLASQTKSLEWMVPYLIVLAR